MPSLNVFNPIRRDMCLAAVFVGMAAYSAFFTYYLTMKHYAFRTLMFDLGLYDHWFWTAFKHGPAVAGVPHNSLTLYILLPFYALYPSPVTLIVLQSIIVPLAAIPLYLLARLQLKDRMLALLVTALFLLYPPLHGLSQFDFHVEMFLPPLALTALYYLHMESWRQYIIASIIMLATMDYAAYIVLMMGVYHIIVYRKNLKLLIKMKPTSLKFSVAKNMLTGLVIIMLALAYFGTSTILSNMKLSVGNPTPGEGTFSLKNLEVMKEMKISYVCKIFGPVAFLPLLSPAPLLMALPWLVHITFTTEPEYLKIFNQYSAFTAPFIFAGLISAFKKIGSRKVKVALAVILIAATIYFIMSTDEVAVSPWPNVGERERLLNELVQQIPPDAGVLTQNNIAPHLTEREKIFMWPLGAPAFGPKNLEDVDYILIDKNQYHYFYAPVPAGYPYDATRVAVEQLLSTGKYRMLVEEDGIEFYRRIG